MAHGSQLPAERPLIVVVEGDEGVRSDLTQTLQQDGYRVLAARDCRDAISLVTGLDLPIDLIITNITVTYLEGHALLGDLARTRHHPPLLFFSTQPPPAPHAEPCEPLALNPHAPEVLRSAVHRLLGLHHRERWVSEETA
jgi:DNA-binding NtrC family response regulator